MCNVECIPLRPKIWENSRKKWVNAKNFTIPKIPKTILKVGNFYQIFIDVGILAKKKLTPYYLMTRKLFSPRLF